MELLDAYIELIAIDKARTYPRIYLHISKTFNTAPDRIKGSIVLTERSSLSWRSLGNRRGAHYRS